MLALTCLLALLSVGTASAQTGTCRGVPFNRCGSDGTFAQQHFYPPPNVFAPRFPPPMAPRPSAYQPYRLGAGGFYGASLGFGGLAVGTGYRQYTQLGAGSPYGPGSYNRYGQYSMQQQQLPYFRIGGSPYSNHYYSPFAANYNNYGYGAFPPSYGGYRPFGFAGMGPWITSNCGCDRKCRDRGDCCADSKEVCGISSAPSPTPTTAVPIGKSCTIYTSHHILPIDLPLHIRTYIHDEL